MRELLVSMALIASLSPAKSAAEIYRAYPSSPLKIAGGFDPLRPTKIFPPCIDSDGIDKNPVSTPASQVRFSSDLATSQDDLFKSLQVDANLSARYTFFSASASLSFSQEATFHDDDVVWVVKAFADYADESLIKPRLNGKALAVVNDPHAFRERCGTEWVGQQHKMAQVAAVFSMHNVDTTLKEKMSGSLNGDTSIMGGSGSISVNVTSVFSEAVKNGRVTLDIILVGGNGISDTGPFVLKSDDLDTVRQELSKLVTGITSQNAAVSTVTTGDFSSFAANLEKSPNADPLLQELYFAYIDYVSRYHRLGEIIRGVDDSYAYLTDKQVEALAAAYNSYADAVSHIFSAGTTCATGRGCRGEMPTVSRVDWPTNPERKCVRWSHGTCYQCESTVVFQNRSAGSRIPLACSHMPSNSTATAAFDGFVVVDQGVDDNKIWNASVTVQLLAPGDAPGNTYCRGPQQDNNCANHLGNPAQGVYRYAWTELRMSRKENASNGSPAWDLYVEECHTGGNINAGCDTVPPGTSTVANGLPANAGPARVTIQVEPQTSPQLFAAPR